MELNEGKKKGFFNERGMRIRSPRHKLRFYQCFFLLDFLFSALSPNGKLEMELLVGNR